MPWEPFVSCEMYKETRHKNIAYSIFRCCYLAAVAGTSKWRKYVSVTLFSLKVLRDLKTLQRILFDPGMMIAWWNPSLKIITRFLKLFFKSARRSSWMNLQFSLFNKLIEFIYGERFFIVKVLRRKLWWCWTRLLQVQIVEVYQSSKTAHLDLSATIGSLKLRPENWYL